MQQGDPEFVARVPVRARAGCCDSLGLCSDPWRVWARVCVRVRAFLACGHSHPRLPRDLGRSLTWRQGAGAVRAPFPGGCGVGGLGAPRGAPEDMELGAVVLPLRAVGDLGTRLGDQRRRTALCSRVPSHPLRLPRARPRRSPSRTPTLQAPSPWCSRPGSGGADKGGAQQGKRSGFSRHPMKKRQNLRVHLGPCCKDELIVYAAGPGPGTAVSIHCCWHIESGRATSPVSVFFCLARG